MRIEVKVKTKARQEEVRRLDDAHFVVAVTEAPEKGRANEAVIRALAKHFAVSVSRIELVSGHTSRQKVFEIAL